jgi:subtilisin family serine protease
MPTSDGKSHIRSSTLLILAASVATVVMGGATARPQAADGEDKTQPLDGTSGGYVPGEVLVKFAHSAPAYGVEDLTAAQGAVRLSEILELGITQMSVAGDVIAAVDAYESSPLVEYAQPNYLVEIFPTVPDDPYYDDGQLLDFHSPEFAGADDFQRWYFAPGMLNAEAAWDLTQGDASIVIAVIDSGVDLDHPELASNIWTNVGETPGNGLDDDGNGFVDDVNGWDFKSNDNDPNPDVGDGIDNDGNGAADDVATHGTEVAGIAAALGNNSSGVAGAVWKAQIMALKVFSDDGSASTSNVLSAVAYATANGADVINLSLGAFDVDCTTSSPAEEEAIEVAVQSGVTVIVSAGNDNSSSPSSPASCTGAISIGASDHASIYWTAVGFGGGDADGRASFSNYGPSVDVVAPGRLLTSTSMFTQADANDGGPPSGTAALVRGINGTSFSAPLVAGLAGLILSRAKALGLDLTPAQVRSLIEDNSVDLSDDPNDSPDGGAGWDGHGMVNFGASVKAVADLVTPTPTPTPIPVPSTGPRGFAFLALAFAAGLAWFVSRQERPYATPYHRHLP